MRNDTMQHVIITIIPVKLLLLVYYIAPTLESFNLVILELWY